MRIRLLQAVTGRFLAGSIVEADDFDALRYLHDHVAELVADPPPAVAESAVLTPEVESATVKRRGRPKKARPPAAWHDDKAPGWKEVEQE